MALASFPIGECFAVMSSGLGSHRAFMLPWTRNIFGTLLDRKHCEGLCPSSEGRLICYGSQLVELGSRLRTVSIPT